MLKKNNVWPLDYFHNPNIDKPIEEIWADIDGYTFEEMYEAQSHLEMIDFVIPLPPLDYKGKVTKGIFYSQAADVIAQAFPRIKEIFFIVANSMFSSYPGSTTADAYFVCYDNKPREECFKKKYPDKKDVVMLPLQDADFLNEYYMAPTFYTPKTIDVFCVSTAFPVKNIPVFARMLKTYEAKYGRRLKARYAVGAHELKVTDGKMDLSNMRYDAKEQLEQVEEILGNVSDYLEVVPFINYNELAKAYSEAKCCVLTSLLEGKNRFISEAMSCDTPIVVFKDFNKYSRGDYPVFFGNSGEYAEEFTPESLADAVHKVITNQDKYEPRKNYLMHSGRKNFINAITDRIPYFEKNIPGFEKGRIHENIWVDLATQVNYQLGYNEFLYGKNPAICYLRGMKNIKPIIEFYFSRFGID